jgi:hypothetical protein
MVASPSLPSAPQLPHAVIDQGTKFLMFSNHSEHPVYLDKNHALGEAQAVVFGTVIQKTRHRIDWADLIRPKSTSRDAPSIGTKPPESVAVEELFGVLHDETEFGAAACTSHCDTDAFEEMLQFDKYGRELPRKRSLPDTTIRLIASQAPRRVKGETFPDNADEDRDANFPQVPAEQSSKDWQICSDLTPVTAHEGLGLGWWIMVAARVCARAYLFGSIIISWVRLSLWLALVVLPVVVRFDVARGTRGIVVRVNTARALCPFFD